VKSGTSTAVNTLRIPVAGKTGTTNDSFDAWFVGFSSTLLTSIWVGYDLNDNPLGKGEAGGRTALPVWIEYSKKALRYTIKEKKELEFKASEGVSMVVIDRETGKKAGPRSIVRIEEAFRFGTEPKVEEISTDVNNDELLTGDE
jgi:penicillin-binding protein 1A